MSYSLGSITISANTATIFQAPDSGVKGILIGNESGLTVTITMESGGVQKTLYPSMLDWFAVRPGFTGNIKIAPTVILNNVSSFPASSLIFDAVGLNDSENASQYPVHMPRNTNIGNSVSTSVTSTNSIVNDGNPISTQIIEATVSGDSSSAVTLTNDAQFVLGDTAHPGKLTTAEIDSPAATDLTENVPTGKAVRWKVNAVEQAHLATTGLLVVPGKLGQTADADIIDASGNDTYLKSRSTGLINFQVPNGTTIASIQSTGIKSGLGASNFDIDTAGTGFVRLLVNGSDVLDATNTGPRLGTGMTMRFLSGTMSRQQGGHSASTSGVTITHGLGATPASVLVTTDIAQPGSSTTGVGSVGSTTFVATSAAGSGFYWWCLAG